MGHGAQPHEWRHMHRFIVSLLVLISMSAAFGIAGAEETKTDREKSTAASPPPLEEILERVEQLYTGSAFAADFKQTSTIKAMEISDTAFGRLQVAYPGKMRWEYIEPDPQLIITDGESLWIYRPQDYQVMVGKADVFFGEGKGAGFLSDIGSIRRDFNITLEDVHYGDYYSLKLLPHQPTYDLVAVFLLINKKNFYISQVFTYNAYEDVTRIAFENLVFKDTLPDAIFHFDIPEGADILELNE